MKLTKISYKEYPGESQEWYFDEISLGDRNLLVGRNATGKSRVLNVVAGLAAHFRGGPPALSGSYVCEFEGTRGTYRYQMASSESLLIEESLHIEGVEMFTRDADGKGQIFTENIGDAGGFLGFQCPTNLFAVVARRDSIQHPYLEELHVWAEGLRFFRFGTNLGKDVMAAFGKGGIPVDDYDQSQIAGIFKRGMDTFGSKYHDAILADMETVGYRVSQVLLAPPVSVRMNSALDGYQFLCVKESDLPGITDQYSMSQGMWRVLTLIIWLNYFEHKGAAACCVVDDVGEGLDFERACQLIEILRNKSVGSAIQLIMSTNDKNVMNGVPLNEWQVLLRERAHVSARNYGNSKELFDDFRFTGLSNFSFFELDVVNSATKAEEK